MKLLALDTATEACSVALEIDGQRLQRFEHVGREHSQRLPAMLSALLAEAGLRTAQLDGVVCGIGPGSFAGVRIGVAYAKGLALGLQRPVFGVTSLAMLAQGAIRRYAARHVVAAIDARMAEVYIGSYHAPSGIARPLDDAAVVAPEAALLPAAIGAADWVAVGSGWGRYAAPLSARLGSAVDIDAAALPEAQDALTLALADWPQAQAAATLVPHYLRHRVALTQAEQLAARIAAAQTR